MPGDTKENAVRAVTVAFFIAVQLFAACGGGSGGSGGSGNSGGTPPPAPSNAAPAITMLSPASANAGGTGFTLTITGYNFLSSSAVQWNGTPLTATYTSSTQLQAQVSAADISSSGSASVSINNPTPGGGGSGYAEFVISASSNPSPTLLSLSPSTVAEGSGSFLLTLNGTNFVPSSSIEWDGASVATTYLSDTQLEAQIPEANIAAQGFADVTVASPGPGGGTSASLTFSISFGPIVVPQLANDLVWDATHQLIYLSVPSLAATNGNSVVALNPLTSTIQSSSGFAGSEPDRVSISDDDHYLYVGIDGSSSVQRFNLPSLSFDINYSLGAAGIFGPTQARDVEVAPGLAHTTAVSRTGSGMEIYDDATLRPTTANGAGDDFDSLQWGSDTAIYGNNSDTTLYEFYTLTVSSSGVVVDKTYLNDFSTFYVSIHYDSGTNLVYTDDGYVISPTTGKDVANFGASGLMIPDSTLNSAFFLGQTGSQAGTQNFTVEEFDLTTYQPVAEVTVPNVQGDPLHFIAWGTNGLAFNDNAGYVYILNNPFATPDGRRLVTPQQYLSPVLKTKATSRQLRTLNVAAKRIRSRWISKKKDVRADSAVPNPAPQITALNPNSVQAGVEPFTLTVTGNNFVSLSTVEWNGSPISTEFVSATELQAQIGAADLSTNGPNTVSVMTPSPGGGSSSALPFTIVSTTPNPAPVILSLYPDNAMAGSTAGFTMNINGLSYFTPSSIVEWNGVPRSATLYNSGQLQIQVNPSDLATPGYALVTVINPGPGGGTSSAEFQILYQSIVVNQVTNDLVWDPVNQVIYISVPGSATTHANQVCVLNPTTAAIGNCVSGNEPDVLAISDDSQFLYVGMDASGSVQRFILPGLTPDISFALGNWGGANNPYFALDLQVAPGAPHTTAVSKGVLLLVPQAVGGITIYDDATPRSISAPGDFPLYDSIQWGADATELSSADSEGESIGFDFYTLSVSSSGIVLDEDYPGVFWNPGRIHFDSGTGLVYSDDGFHAVNPATGLPAGLFEVGGGWPMAPDSALNTVFILDQYDFQENSNYTIDMFDMTDYLPVNHLPFYTTFDGLMQLGRFIRWGTNGLALNDLQGNIYLISGPFVSADHSSRSKAAPGARKRR